MKLPIVALALSGALLSPDKSCAASTRDIMEVCGELLQQLRTGADGKINFPLTFRNGVCWGYFGAVQGLSRIQSDKDTDSQTVLHICAPPDTTLTQFIRIFVDFAQKHPTLLDKPGETVILTALITAFPCR
jgi:hypothetical protein